MLAALTASTASAARLAPPSSLSVCGSSMTTCRAWLLSWLLSALSLQVLLLSFAALLPDVVLQELLCPLWVP